MFTRKSGQEKVDFKVSGSFLELLKLGLARQKVDSGASLPFSYSIFQFLKIDFLPSCIKNDLT